jgi:hypothetical protein
VAVRLAAGAKAKRLAGSTAYHCHGDDSGKNVLRDLWNRGCGDAATLRVAAEGEFLARAGLGLRLKTGEHVLHSKADRVSLGVGLLSLNPCQSRNM